MYKLTTSMMCADIFNLKDTLSIIDKHTDIYHIDIMDGHFVPNLALSFDYVKELSKHTKKPIDVHLMIEKPENHIEDLIKYGVEYITLHPKTISGHEFKIINQIKSAGIKLGIAISPGTDLSVMKIYLKYIDKITIMTVEPGFAGQKMIEEVLPKISEAKELREKYNLNYLIEVDGSNNFNTFKKYITRGTDVFVLGTGLFNNPNLDQSYIDIRTFIEREFAEIES